MGWISKAALHLNADQAMADEAHPFIALSVYLISYSSWKIGDKKAGVEVKEVSFFCTEAKDRQPSEFS